jgi:hypothetical protein
VPGFGLARPRPLRQGRTGLRGAGALRAFGKSTVALSREELSASLRCSKSAAKRAIAELAERGHIEIVRKHNHANSYVLRSTVFSAGAGTPSAALSGTNTVRACASCRRGSTGRNAVSFMRLSKRLVPPAGENMWRNICACSKHVGQGAFACQPIFFQFKRVGRHLRAPPDCDLLAARRGPPAQFAIHVE